MQLRQWLRYFFLLWLTALFVVLIALANNCSDISISKKLIEHDHMLKNFIDILSRIFGKILVTFKIPC